MKPKFRAWYKPDFERGFNDIKFEQREIEEELYFVHENGEAGVFLQYAFQTPFCDPEWIVEQYIGHDDVDGVEIYEGDILEYTYEEPKLDFNLIYSDGVNEDVKIANLWPKHGETCSKTVSELKHTIFGTPPSKTRIVGNIHESK